jgi:hypothetical protein
MVRRAHVNGSSSRNDKTRVSESIVASWVGGSGVRSMKVAASTKPIH